MSTVPNILAVLVTACGFSSNFILSTSPTELGLPTAAILALVKLAVLIAPAVYAYLYPSNLRRMFFVMLGCFVVGLPFALMPEPGVVTALARCTMEALSITLTASVLSLLPNRSIFSTVALGLGTSMLLVAGMRLIPGLTGPLASQCLLALYFVAAALSLFRTDRDTLSFPRGRGENTALQTPAAILHSLFRHRESMLPVIGLAALLMLVLGMFENHFATGGFEFSLSGTSLLVSAVVFVSLAMLGRVWHPETWFAKLFAGLMLVCVAGLLLMLLVPGASEALSGYFGTMTAVAMIPMCVYSTELAKESGLSPIMVAGPLCTPIMAGLSIGGLLNAALFALLGADAYNVSNIAAIALATIAAMVIAVFMLAGFRKLDNNDDADTPPSLEDTDEALRQLLMEKGLSEREAQIAVLYSQGRSVPYISHELALAESTIKSHIKHVYVKIDVHNKQNLLDYIEHLRA